MAILLSEFTAVRDRCWDDGSDGGACSHSDKSKAVKVYFCTCNIFYFLRYDARCLPYFQSLYTYQICNNGSSKLCIRTVTQLPKHPRSLASWLRTASTVFDSSLCVPSPLVYVPVANFISAALRFNSQSQTSVNVPCIQGPRLLNHPSIPHATDLCFEIANY